MKTFSVILIVSLAVPSIQSLTCQQCTGTGYECQDGLDNGLGMECDEKEKCWFQHDYSFSSTGQDRYIRMCGKGLEIGCLVEAGVYKIQPNLGN